jgi:hypothetical protein
MRALRRRLLRLEDRFGPPVENGVHAAVAAAHRSRPSAHLRDRARRSANPPILHQWLHLCRQPTNDGGPHTSRDWNSHDHDDRRTG